jgi:hypothetical protein
MAARRTTSVCLPVSNRSAVEFRRYDSRTPILTIRAGYPAALVSLTLPDRVEEGHVQFARQLAQQAARYAMEVERAWRGLPALTLPSPAREAVAS